MADFMYKIFMSDLLPIIIIMVLGYGVVNEMCLPVTKRKHLISWYKLRITCCIICFYRTR